MIIHFTWLLHPQVIQQLLDTETLSEPRHVFDGEVHFLQNTLVQILYLFCNNSYVTYLKAGVALVQVLVCATEAPSRGKVRLLHIAIFI